MLNDTLVVWLAIGHPKHALAFFGLEDWALELAQQSYNAFSASSHLFLADRYRGEFNKNSELFQGFLTDPTAFGGSNRFATLVPTAGNYRTLGFSYDKGDDRLSNPYIRLNGLFDFPRRSAYYLDAESGVGTTKTDSVDPDGKQGQASVRPVRAVDLVENKEICRYATSLRVAIDDAWIARVLQG